MKKLLFLITLFGFNSNLYADRESTISGNGERTPEQRYSSCMYVWLEDDDVTFEEADEYCSQHLEGLSEEEKDEIREEVESDVFSGDGRGISLSVTNGEIPGQPIDMPKRPVVYSVGPNGAPGIIDPPRGPWPVTRPIHITREMDDGRGGVIVREIVPDFEDVPENCDDPTIVCNSQGLGHGGLVRQLEPMFSVTTEECDRGGTVGLICSYDENQELVASTTSNLQSALTVLKDSGLEITPEGILVAGGVVGTIALVARYARSLNPLGAFALGLGVAPVAASDYCSMYSGDEGFEYFVNELSNEEQLQEFGACPELSQRVVDFAIQIQEAE